MPRLLLALALCASAQSVSAQDAPARKGPKGAAWEQDEYEEKSVKQAVERALKAADTEAVRWKKEMDKAFPDRAPTPLTEDDLTKWFDLLADGAKDWRRDDSPNRQLGELFDRVAQRLELGPVPALRREEFLQYARKALLPRNREAPKPGDKFADADRVFRVLDRDGSGVLEKAEWTERHKAEPAKIDADGDRTIDAAEYRTYFAARVAEGVEAPAKAAKAAAAAAPRAGLPGWFKELDADGDGQVDLAEWRLAGRPIAEFQEFDLNGDGLLPPDEYLRFVRLSRPPAGADKDPMTVPVNRRMKP